MIATKNNLQLRHGLTRKESVYYHNQIGAAHTEISVDHVNSIKSSRKAKK